MARFFCSILVLNHPVMCDTIEAATADEARQAWAAKFWSDPDTFRKEIPAMDETNRECAARLLTMMEATREEAKMHGVTVMARPSRAKVG